MAVWRGKKGENGLELAQGASTFCLLSHCDTECQDDQLARLDVMWELPAQSICGCEAMRLAGICRPATSSNRFRAEITRGGTTARLIAWRAARRAEITMRRGGGRRREEDDLQLAKIPGMEERRGGTSEMGEEGIRGQQTVPRSPSKPWELRLPFYCPAARAIAHALPVRQTHQCLYYIYCSLQTRDNLKVDCAVSSTTARRSGSVLPWQISHRLQTATWWQADRFTVADTLKLPPPTQPASRPNALPPSDP